MSVILKKKKQQVANPSFQHAGKRYDHIAPDLVSGLSYALLTFFARESYLFEPASLYAAIGLGGIGLSAVLSFVAAISARAGGNGTLMAILSLPLLTPLLYLLVNLGGDAFGLMSGQAQTIIVYLLALDLVGLAVGLVLFPFVWRD